MFFSRHSNLFESNRYNGFHWNAFSPPYTTGVEFSKSLTNRKMYFSIGIYSFPMDPMDSIGTTFHPLIQHERNFSKSLTNRKWTFPSESIRVQWIRWTPSERLSTPSSNMSGIFLSLSRIENELFHRNLFVSNGSNTLGRTLHHYTSGFPMESKGIRLDSSRQYWTTLQWKCHTALDARIMAQSLCVRMTEINVERC